MDMVIEPEETAESGKEYEGVSMTEAALEVIVVLKIWIWNSQGMSQMMGTVVIKNIG